MIAAALLIIAIVLLVLMFRADKQAAKAGEEGRYNIEGYYDIMSFKLGLMAFVCLIAFVVLVVS